MEQRNRIFITGVGGMEGRALAKIAVSQKYHVFGTVFRHISPDLSYLTADGRINLYSVDLRDVDETRRVLQDAKPDTLVHLAGHSLDNTAGVNVYFDNLRIFDSVLRGIRELRHSPRTILASGTIVYGRPQSADSIYEQNPLFLPEPNRSLEFYRASKTDQERILSCQGGIDYVIARPTQHTGPGRIPNVVEVDIANEIFKVQSGIKDSIQVRNRLAEVDMLDARDVARAYLTLARCGKPKGVYHISSQNPVSVEELIKTFLGVVGLPKDIPVETSPNEHPTYMRISSQKIRQLGWHPKFSLEQALRSFWESYT